MQSAVRTAPVDQIRSLVRAAGEAAKGVDDYGCSLVFACGSRAPTLAGTVDVCRFLVEEIGLDKAQTNTISQSTPLHNAAFVGNVGMIEYLIEQQCDVEVTENKLKHTPLFSAASAGHAAVVAFLLRSRAMADRKDLNNQSPLFYAAKLSTECTASLLSASASADCVDSWSQGPLFFAAREGQDATVRLLVKARAAVNAADREFRTALWFAVRDSRASTAFMLLKEFGAELPAKKIKGDGMGNGDLFDMATDRGLTEVVEELRVLKQKQEEAEAALVRVAQAEVLLQQKLFDAARSGTASEVDSQVAQGRDPLAPNAEGSTVLHIAASRADSEGPTICQRLIWSHGATPSFLDRRGRTPLFAAARAGLESSVEVILDGRCDVDVVDVSGDSALFEAARGGHIGVMRTLLERGALASRRNTQQCTPVLCATGSGAPEVLRLLVDRGADASATDGDGRSGLFFADSEGWAKALLDLRCDMHMADRIGQTALASAVASRCEPVVRLLLERSANADGPADAEGRLPLHRAAGAECVKLLLRARAQVDGRDAQGQTALFYAARGSDMQVARALVAAGAAGNAADNQLRTALFDAAQHAPLELVRLLVEEGFADPNARDRQRRMACNGVRKDPERKTVAEYLTRASKQASAAQGKHPGDEKRRRYCFAFKTKEGEDIPYQSEAYREALDQLGKACPWLMTDAWPENAALTNGPDK